MVRMSDSNCQRDNEINETKSPKNRSAGIISLCFLIFSSFTFLIANSVKLLAVSTLKLWMKLTIFLPTISKSSTELPSGGYRYSAKVQYPFPTTAVVLKHRIFYQRTVLDGSSLRWLSILRIFLRISSTLLDKNFSSSSSTVFLFLTSRYSPMMLRAGVVWFNFAFTIIRNTYKKRVVS